MCQSDQRAERFGAGVHVARAVAAQAERRADVDLAAEAGDRAAEQLNVAAGQIRLVELLLLVRKYTEPTNRSPA